MITRRWPVYTAILLTTALALVLRIWQLTRPGSLTGIVEYDDGPYVGSSILLTHGFFPYRDYIFVQPPGITILLWPIAELARLGWISIPAVMATGRVITTVVSALGVTLAGLLVRHRGAAAVLIAGGVLAVYTGSLQAAHTVLLEPWLVLFILGGALFLFQGDRLAQKTWRFFAGGLIFGFAAAVEAWAILPVLVVTFMCLSQWRRLIAFAAGVTVGFTVPVLPFALKSLHGFWAGVITAQIGSRANAVRVSPLYRFKQMASLSWINPLSSWVTIIGALLLVSVIILAITFATVSTSKGPPPLEWFALTVCAGSVVMFLWPSQFLYHFMGWLGAWLALSIALPLSRAADAMHGLLPWTHQRWTQVVLGSCAVIVIGGFAALQVATLPTLRAAPVLSSVIDQIVSPGACVLSDTSPPLILLNRLVPASRSCTVMMDPMGADLELSHGLKPSTGASHIRAVEVMWWKTFRNTQYVLLRTPTTSPRIAWTPQLWDYFQDKFKIVYKQKIWIGRKPEKFKLYQRVPLASEGWTGITGHLTPAYHKPKVSMVRVGVGLLQSLWLAFIFLAIGVLMTAYAIWGDRRHQKNPDCVPLWGWVFFPLVMITAVSLSLISMIIPAPLWNPISPPGLMKDVHFHRNRQWISISLTVIAVLALTAIVGAAMLVVT